MQHSLRQSLLHKNTNLQIYLKINPQTEYFKRQKENRKLNKRKIQTYVEIWK